MHRGETGRCAVTTNVGEITCRVCLTRGWRTRRNHWGINIRDLKRTVVPPPSSSGQRAVADYFGRETAKIDAPVAKVRETIDRLEELRTALISAAVTGKIDVREAGT